jgi:hypothetical protein
MPVSLARLARWACLGALLAGTIGCASRNGVEAWRHDAPAGVYPAGEMSGEPVYRVGMRRALY